MKRLLALGFMVAIAACATHPMPVHKRAHRVLGKPWVEGKRDMHGKKNGTWVRYDASGRKIIEGNFRGDVMHGTWTFWFDDGTELRLVYHNGVRVNL